MPIAARLRPVVVAVLAAAIAGLATLLGTAPMAHADGLPITIAVSVPQSGNVTCANGSGTALGADPTLHLADTVTCTITGLGKSEQVDVTLDAGARDLGKISTDANGTATFQFTVPDGLSVGGHSLMFTGATSTLAATFPFTFAASGAGAGGTGGGGPSGLAWTGTEVAGLLGAALALLAAGAVVTVTARQRRHG
ncbi:MAG TPA: hypothetical protein VGD84_21635 [Pseudonocardiaceae bacterium]